MRRKFTMTVGGPMNGNREWVNLREQITVPPGHVISADSIAVNWDYPNTGDGASFLTLTDASDVLRRSVGVGYVTFGDLAILLAKDDIVITPLPIIGKCKLRNGSTKSLLVSANMRAMLGIVDPDFAPGVERQSENKVDFSVGLRFVRLHCSIVDDTKCFEEHGGHTHRSKCLAIIPLPTGPLSGVTQHVFYSGSGVLAIAGALDNVELWVTDQDNKEVAIGQVVVNFTISQE